MISHIKGVVEVIGPNHAILDVNGVGYKIFLTSSDTHELKIGKKMTVFTYFSVREDSQDLYGFLNEKDREVFELLITISGIGPKSAMNILSLSSRDNLVGAIRTGSAAHLTKISGIGRKTAEKIVLELRDKIISVSSDRTHGHDALSSDLDAIEALKSLGYDAEESREALKTIDKEIKDVSAKVKAALKLLG